MNKIIIPIIAIIILAAGIGTFVIFQKPAFPEPKNIRDSFFEVHMEPGNANESMFKVLSEFVNLADQYNVKLTLLFTPQWAEMILKDNKKLSLLNQWKRQGHEIGGHHHGPSVCPWDGYTNLDVNSQEFKNRQDKIKFPPPHMREKGTYLGNMDDYMKLLGKLGVIMTITMSDEDVDWPKGALYAAGGRRVEGAISNPQIVNFSGHEVYKLTSAPLEPRADTVTGVLITIDELKKEYLSEKEGVFGVGAHEISYRDNPNLYKQWFEFLREQNSKSKTISQIIEEFKNPKNNADSAMDFPFGMHTAATRPYLKPKEGPTADLPHYNDALNIGVGWERPGQYVSYPFDFTYFDKFYGNIPKGINILANIETPRQKGTFKLRIPEQKYADFVKNLVERYDGDGKNDMSGLKNPIKYWQIDNEPPFWQLGQSDKLSGSPMQWMRSTRDDYAKVLELAGNAIHSTCSDCKLVIGGMIGMGIEQSKDIFKEFYEPILKKLGGKYIDVFDFHIFGNSKDDYRNSKIIYKMVREGLDRYRYDNTAIWILETGTYSGQPIDMGKALLKQSEKEQAKDLIKRFVYPLTLGVEKVFWAWAMVEGTSPIDDNDFFDNTGFIYDGIGENDFGYGVKKLSYYTYKKMVETLEGSDWDNIQTIQESDGIYVYKFQKASKNIWAVWNDNLQEKQVTISGITSSQVKITEAIPKYESGKEVKDYNSAFKTETKTASGGKITITLKDKPVFVEEQ